MNESGNVEISKLEAAQRQLRVGIEMIFQNQDHVAAHTLIGAASVILSDLAEKPGSHLNWDNFAQESNELSKKDYFSIMREAQNFLKHAKNDSDVVFELKPSETESLAFWAVMNLSGFVELPIEESVFQLWYLAAHSPILDHDTPPFSRALEIFGDLRDLSLVERREIGYRVLQEQLNENTG